MLAATDSSSLVASCYQIFFAYDRDAFGGYELPAEAGFKIGKGTPYSRLLMQWHYVLPPCDGKDGPESCTPYDAKLVFGKGDGKGHGVISDHSGFELTLTPDLREHDAATIAVIDPYIMYDWGAPRFLYHFETTDFGMNRMLQVRRSSTRD